MNTQKTKLGIKYYVFEYFLIGHDIFITVKDKKDNDIISFCYTRKIDYDNYEPGINREVDKIFGSGNLSLGTN